MRAAPVALLGSAGCQPAGLGSLPRPGFRCGLQYAWHGDALDRVARKYTLASVCSSELSALCENYETVWDRTHWPISSVDSFFSYDFRAPLCSGSADRGGERLALAENYFAGDRLHGLRANGSHAFQSAR